MEKTFKTEQETFWAGEFGDEYLARNQGEKLIAGNLALFTKILSSASSIRSAIEFGSNIGLNLLAIRQLLPDVDLSAIEINLNAARIAERISGVTVYNLSLIHI